eukprot:GHUV01004920.1.p1 GENE.GHUV01004920.1~~GHUV01004920.1.p1  ORF type:complete len:257 (+),score=44.47 GHUV01004920.1:189-959(+)
MWCISATAGQLRAPSTCSSSTRRTVTCHAVSKRHFISSFIAGPVLLAAGSATAVKEGGFGDNCPTCLGPVDGTLGSCSGLDPCSSSYDDRPANFAAPWMFDGSRQSAMRQLVSTLQELGCTVQLQTDAYVYATSSAGQGGTVTDLEFLFADNDNTIAVRAAPQQQPTTNTSSTPANSNYTVQAAFANFSELSKVANIFSSSQPSQVLENIRIQCGWEEVPILRNRRRTFFFGESPFDSFGPVAPPVPDYSKDLMDL